MAVAIIAFPACNRKKEPAPLQAPAPAWVDLSSGWEYRTGTAGAPALFCSGPFRAPKNRYSIKYFYHLTTCPLFERIDSVLFEWRETSDTGQSRFGFYTSGETPCFYTGLVAKRPGNRYVFEWIKCWHEHEDSNFVVREIPLKGINAGARAKVIWKPSGMLLYINGAPVLEFFDSTTIGVQKRFTFISAQQGIAIYRSQVCGSPRSAQLEKGVEEQKIARLRMRVVKAP